MWCSGMDRSGWKLSAHSTLRSVKAMVVVVIAVVVGRMVVRQRRHRVVISPTLETELLDRSGFANRNQARTAIFDFIEGFYNTRRRHSAIGYQSPADYERSHQANI